MDHEDPRAFEGTAEHYAAGRPPYSAELAETLTREIGLDGTGRLLDVGCGPGAVELALAGNFAWVAAIDPVAEMLDVAERRCAAAGIENVRWYEGVAEEIPTLGLRPCRAATFGQSFHRVRRHEVAEAVYDLLEPGGSIVLLSHEVRGRPRPPDLGLPPIPDEAMHALVVEYLGEPARRHLEEVADDWSERFEQSLSKTRFGAPRVVFAPGRDDLVRDVDAVVDNLFSKSFAAPPLFGARREEFEADLRRLLLERSADGHFWEWPGDTELVIATKGRATDR